MLTWVATWVSTAPFIQRFHQTIAIETLAQIAGDSAQPAAARVTAAGVLLDRGWGKAKQTTEVTGEDSGPLIHTIRRVIVYPRLSN